MRRSDRHFTSDWTPVVLVWMLVCAPVLALAADQAGGLLLVDAGPAERDSPTAARAPDRNAKDRSNPENSPPKRRGRFAASIQMLRPPVLPGPFGAVPPPPVDDPQASSETSVTVPAPAGAWTRLGLLGRSAPAADGVAVPDPQLVRRDTLAWEPGQTYLTETISVRVIQPAGGADRPGPQAESLAPPGGGRQAFDPLDSIHHVSPLSSFAALEPGSFDSSQAFLSSLGERPLGPGQATIKFRGAHRLLYKAARSRYRKALREQFKDEFLRDGGGDIFLRHRDNLERGSHLMATWLQGKTFSSEFSQALVLEGQPARPRRLPVTEIGTEVNILTLGPVRLRNDLRIRLDSLDVDLFDYFRSDDPVEDWLADIDDSVGLLGNHEQTVAQAPSAEGPLALGSARRQLVPRGNLYTGDSVSVDGKVRLRLRLRRDLMDAIAGSPSGEIRTVFYGGTDHRPVARLVLSVRSQGVDAATVSLTLTLYEF